MSTVRRIVNAHPYIVGWVALAIIMVAMLLYFAKDVGFTPSQWAAMIAATIALAGGCVWIISWE